MTTHAESADMGDDSEAIANFRRAFGISQPDEWVQLSYRVTFKDFVDPLRFNPYEQEDAAMMKPSFWAVFIPLWIGMGVYAVAFAVLEGSFSGTTDWATAFVVALALGALSTVGAGSLMDRFGFALMPHPDAILEKMAARVFPGEYTRTVMASVEGLIVQSRDGFAWLRPGAIDGYCVGREQVLLLRRRQLEVAIPKRVFDGEEQYQRFVHVLALPPHPTEEDLGSHSRPAGPEAQTA